MSFPAKPVAPRIRMSLMMGGGKKDARHRTRSEAITLSTHLSKLKTSLSRNMAHVSCPSPGQSRYESPDVVPYILRSSAELGSWRAGVRVTVTRTIGVESLWCT